MSANYDSVYKLVDDVLFDEKLLDGFSKLADSELDAYRIIGVYLARMSEEINEMDASNEYAVNEMLFGFAYYCGQHENGNLAQVKLGIKQAHDTAN